RQDERRGSGRAAVPADGRGARPRRAAVQHLLLAVPRRVGQRPRHDRPARLQTAAVVPHRPAAAGAARPFLRRHDDALRRDAGLQGTDRAARSLGDCGVHPRAAAEPARDFLGFIARRPAETPALMDTNALTTIDSTDIATLRQRGLYAAVAGLAVGGIGAGLQPGQFMPSWLIGFTFCTGLSLGWLALLMMQHMTSGYWGLVTRRVFEAGSRLLPYCALLFIPVAVSLPSLYSWARPDVVAADEVLRYKAFYFKTWFFIARTVIYFAV